MKLVCIGSSSVGNAYALDAGGEILLLEAGIRHTLVSKAIGFRDDKVVGCLVSHHHIDHAKYVEEYSRRGVKIICNQDVANRKKLEMGRRHIFQKPLDTFSVGSFRVCPIPLHHFNNDGSECPCHGFLIHHESMGNLFFASDTYKLDFYLSGVDHWLIEANYDDRILKANVEDGKIDRHQANRLMLSHMSLDNTVRFLRDCSVGCGTSATKSIILCHLSERNSDPAQFKSAVESATGVPTYIACKDLVVELNKEVI